MDQRGLQSVLFFTPFGAWSVHNQLDVVVAQAMRLRGRQVTYVTCDGFYQPCSITHDLQDCEACRKTMSDTMAPFHLDSIPLGDLITAEDVAEADTWVAMQADDALARACFDELEVGEWVLSTVMTHFRVSRIDQIRNPTILPVHRRFLRDTLLTYWVLDRLLQEHGIDCLFLFNARLYPYRAALEAAFRRGVRVLVHERGLIANTFSFFENEGCLGQNTPRGVASGWAAIPLEEKELRQIDQYFSEKFLGIYGNWPSFYKAETLASVRDLLNVPHDALLVGFFSTSPDEIAHLDRYKGAEKQFDLIETIAKSLPPKHYLVVRHHPFMGGGGGSPVEATSFYETYRRALSRQANVRIIMPRDKISSYALFPHIVAAIAPFSTIGFETIAFGIPTLVSEGSEVAFDEGLTLNDWSFASVSRQVGFITSRDAKITADLLRRFYRNIYSVLFRTSMKFDVVGIKDYFYPSIDIENDGALLQGGDPSLDRICDNLLHGTHVHPRPDSISKRRTPTEEDTYIASQLDFFDKRGEQRRAHTATEPRPAAASSKFAILVDTSVGAATDENPWLHRPHEEGVSLDFFGPRDSNGPFAGLTKRLKLIYGGGEQKDFDLWARGLRRALRNVSESYVLVSSGRFHFHDTSLAAIGMVLEAAGPSRPPLLAMSGWFRDENALRPLCIQLSKLALSDWRDLQRQLGRKLSARDVLSLAVVRREWLLKNLKSAEVLETSIIEAAARVEGPCNIEEPIFLWQ